MGTCLTRGAPIKPLYAAHYPPAVVFLIMQPMRSSGFVVRKFTSAALERAFRIDYARRYAGQRRLTGASSILMWIMFVGSDWWLLNTLDHSILFDIGYVRLAGAVGIAVPIWLMWGPRALDERWAVREISPGFLLILLNSTRSAYIPWTVAADPYDVALKGAVFACRSTTRSVPDIYGGFISAAIDLICFLRTFRYRFKVVVGLRRRSVVGDSTFELGRDYSLGEHSAAWRANQETFVRSQRLREKLRLRDQLERYPCTPPHYHAHDNQRGRSYPLPV